MDFSFGFFRSGIAIAEGKSDGRANVAKANVIDGPTVDGYGCDSFGGFCGALMQASDDAIENFVDIPVEAIGGSEGLVWEAVDDIYFWVVVAPAEEGDSAALCA